MNIRLDVLKRPTFLLKLVELVLAAACVGLVTGMWMLSIHRMQFVHGTFIGFLMVTCVIIAASLTDTSIHSVLSMVISGIAAVMFIVAGAFCIDSYTDQTAFRGELLGAGIIALVDVVVYVADVAFTYKFYGS